MSIELHDQQQQFPAHLALFLYGSSPLLGSWDPNRAIQINRVDEYLWNLELVIPACCENVEFNFLVKDHDNPTFQRAEEQDRRLLLGESTRVNTKSCAVFKRLDAFEELKLLVSVHVESMPPSSLAAMWKAHKEDLKSNGSQMHTNFYFNNNTGTIALTPQPPSPSILKGDFQEHKSLDNEDKLQDHADNLVNPKNLHQHVSVQVPESRDPSNLRSKSLSSSRSVSVQDLVVLGAESEKEHSSRPAVDPHITNYSLETSSNCGDELVNKLSNSDGVMLNAALEKSVLDELPEAGELLNVGRHACLVADQLLVPKERRRLAIIMVGLPARGKTFTATKLARYLKWLGHKTKHFNVGQYRRLKHGCNQKADFFRSDNRGGLDARNEVAALAMEDMLAWMQEGGQIGIFDATNSTIQRRNMLSKISEGKCKVIFLEVVCNDQTVIERNIRLKIQQSPDYVDMPDFEESLKDFKIRLANYEKAYQSVAEGSYIKMIDTVGGEGGQVQINNISGYLPGRILFFLVNTHTNPRPIFLSRPGESLGSICNLVGGDRKLSELGERYGQLLGNFMNERLKGEQTASVWTSTLQRTLATAQHLLQFPRVQWRALDDISAGTCDGMTYEEIKSKMADEYKARTLDKLRYRYPRGESYLDVIQRLEPVIIELERQHSPVIIVAHQAVLRSLYGYFADKPLEQIPYIEIPVHTVIEVQMGVVGVEEKRYKLL